MKRFATLVRDLEDATQADERIRLLVRYMEQASGEDVTWAVALLTRRQLPKLVAPDQYTTWTVETAGLPPWLIEVSVAATGDPSEMAALVLPSPVVHSQRTLSDIMDAVQALNAASAGERRSTVLDLWQELDPGSRFLLNKMLTGTFPVAVPVTEIAKAIALRTGGNAHRIEHQLSEPWDPRSAALMRNATASPSTDHATPLRFHPIQTLAGIDTPYGEARSWLVEWSYAGLRAQLIKRGGETFLWSESEELLSNRFPEIIESAQELPEGTVVEGTIVAWLDGRPGPLRALDERLALRRPSTPRLRRTPAAFIARDVLEYGGEETHRKPLSERCVQLASLMASIPEGSALVLSPHLACASWDDVVRWHAQARSAGAAGVLLRSREAAFLAPESEWLQWPAEPLLVQAVLLYAERNVRAGSAIERLTLALRDGDRFVPVGAVEAALPEPDREEVARFVSANTVERYGPVRTVRPGLVFDLAFDEVAPSARRKSGVVLRNLRIVRRRPDLGPGAVSPLSTLLEFLAASGHDATWREEKRKRN